MNNILIPLTPAEVRVAELAVRGFTSPYIAVRLYLSVRTVECHLKHVYGKLGVTCRDELIELRWAA